MTGPYDVEVDDSFGYATFGTQSFRISNVVTSGSFGDWAFSKSLVNEVGESTSTNNGFSGGIRQPRFEAQFDIASTVPGAEQPGLQVSVAPDRGDGSRMSFLRFNDTSGGINVTFADVQGTTNPANFVLNVIATGLNRSVPHTVKLTMDVLDGPSNDVVKVYIDGTLVHTGTSWENYYRFDSEASAEQYVRTTDSLIFQARSGGGTAPATLGNGFLIDNLSLSSGPIPVGSPTNKDQCKKDGWKTFTNPIFKNQGDCVSYVETIRLLETVYVPATGNVGIDTLNTLKTGKKYIFKVSGTYRFATWGEAGIADAMYSYRIPGSYNSTGVNAWINGDVFPGSYTNWLKLWVNNLAVPWIGSYTDHNYEYEFTGLGNKVHFSILDDAYGDNVGGLTVNIYSKLH